MDISNIYLKNESFEIFAQDGVKLVDLVINKGIFKKCIYFQGSDT